MVDSPPSKRRPIPRTVIAGGVLVAVFAVIAFWQLRRPQRQADLIERIKEAGGFVTTEPPPTLTERLSAFQSGSGWLAGYTAVGLYTSDITGEWLHELHDLDTLDITDLKLAETALTDSDLARFVTAHPLHVLQLRDEQIGDETVAALAKTRELFMLEVRDSPLTDEQFGRLPLEQLEELRIDGTQVTSGGLQALTRARKLYALILDGRQFDEGSAQVLSGLPELRQLDLFGRDVSDDDLQWLEGLTQLEFLKLSRTSVTEDGLKQLEKALPNCEVNVK